MHRNSGANKIRVNDESIIIIKDASKHQGFIKPIGNSTLIEDMVLNDWLIQSHIISEQTDLFLLLKIADSSYALKEELDKLKEFTNHRTP